MRDGHEAYGWVASLTAVHRRGEGAVSSCPGRIYHYTCRIHPPESDSYERCLGMSWCTICREVADNIVFVARDTVLWDALGDLPADERERLSRSQRKLRDYLDRLVRQGRWPPETTPPDPPDQGRRRDRRPARRRRPPRLPLAEEY
ncbi:hypothetical protein [Actinoplanes campanulatus]|uniref:hypothetical protein n=1 Tax=Actinoplanes campanulatus TaxID=113559 RepID=UPI0019530C4F|nr:hypothetical protein [Actinoplanes capillaceus]